jgi:homoserine kinase
MPFRSAPVAVRAPATSANLGPGFDALGLALTLYDDVEARVAAGGVTVAVTGEGAGELPADERHLVVRAMNEAFDAIGERPPGLALRCHNRIPQARGLGSSSAAIVSGILLARALTEAGPERLDDAGVLRLAAGIEGHPDNVAACLLGGLTVAWAADEGVRAVRIEPHAEVQPFLWVPRTRGLTETARAALPSTVPHADAARNAGRAALLVHALTARPDLLYPATEDLLHQRYRAGGAPETAALVAELRAVDVAAVVSGAGPSVLALARRGWTPDAVDGWLALPLDVDRAGAQVGGSGMLEHAERDPVAAGRAS